MLTVVNLRSVRIASGTQQLTSALKLTVLWLVALACLALGPAAENHPFLTAPSAGPVTVTGTIAAFQLVLGALNGWAAPAYFGAETRDSRRGAARPLLYGALVVSATYVLINVAILYIVPVETLVDSKLPAADAIERVASAHGLGRGLGGRIFVAVAVLSLPSTPQAVMMQNLAHLACDERGRTLLGVGSADQRARLSLQRDLGVRSGGAHSRGDQHLRDALPYVHRVCGPEQPADPPLRCGAPAKALSDLPRPYRVIGYPWTLAPIVVVDIVVFTGFASRNLRQCLVSAALVAALFGGLSPASAKRGSRMSADSPPSVAGSADGLSSAAREYLAAAAGALGSESPGETAARIVCLTREHDRWRGEHCLNMNAAEGLMSRGARQLLASDFATRVTEGIPGDKVFPHRRQNRFIDEIEGTLIGLARKLFHARCVEWRPVTTSMANAAVFVSLTRPGDTIAVQPETAGGNYSYNVAGFPPLVGLNVAELPYTGRCFELDVAGAREVVRRRRPRMIVVGGSNVLFPYPLKELRALADEVGALLLYDAAHVGLLIAAGKFQRPLEEGAHLMTISTHKIMGGAVGGMILMDDPAWPREDPGAHRCFRRATCRADARSEQVCRDGICLCRAPRVRHGLCGPDRRERPRTGPRPRRRGLRGVRR